MINSVLVTGGTGYFGRAFVRRVLDLGATRVCVYSRDEHKQAQMRESVNDDQRLRWFIGDVRDRDRLTRAMDGVDVVVHAAALKRIEVGNYAPDEMVKTNVNGAANVIEAAFVVGVKKVVALSTDKAFEPVSPYGQSKALAESMFVNANNMFGEHGPRYSCVRYGNIFASTGSVVPRWRQMIAAGAKRVPVSDPDCTRFFMKIEEAVDLVVNAINTMKGGEVVIPNWLPAYRVADLAQAMGVEIDIVGLPIWEKKHESMRQDLCSETARRMSVEELREALSRA